MLDVGSESKEEPLDHSHNCPEEVDNGPVIPCGYREGSALEAGEDGEEVVVNHPGWTKVQDKLQPGEDRMAF